jgi:hypothetical protein
MRSKVWRTAGVIIAVLMAVAVPMMSASAQNSGPTFYTLNPGQTVEWDLHYNGSNNTAVVEVAAMPQGSVGFNVFTNQQWINADTGTPIGKGTQWSRVDTSSGQRILQNNGDLMWETGQSAAEVYHIQVYSTASQPVQYSITATGAGVDSLGPFAPQKSTIQLAQAQPGTSNATTQAQTATGTSSAIAQTGTTGAASQAPRTLPVTGGAEELALFICAGAMLVAAGWLVRRRSY